MSTSAQPQGTWYLYVLSGPLAGQSRVIDQSIVTLGRDASNHIVLDLPSISRKHARLAFQSGWFYVEDLGSVNGVTINGVRISAPQAIQSGDQIALSSDLTFVLEWVAQTDQTAVMGSVAQQTPPQGIPAAQQYPASVPQQQAVPPVAVGPVSQAQPTLAPKGGGIGLGVILPVVGCGLLLLAAVAAIVVWLLIRGGIIPGLAATPAPVPTATWTALPLQTPTSNALTAPTLTAVPTPTSYPTYTPYPTYTVPPMQPPTATPIPTQAPTETPVPTDTPQPTDTPVPTNTALPTSTPLPTNTPVPPTSTPTRTPVPPTATPTRSPLTIDWALLEARCLSKDQWLAKFQITVSGGVGQYTYYRDIDKIAGPTSAASYVYELKYGANAAAVGTFLVESGGDRKDKGFWVKHPDCSGF